MIVQRFKCHNCQEEHDRKTYENVSEGTADIFTETYFTPIWDKLKEKAADTSLEDFCKEFMFTAIYYYHKNRRRIKVAQDSIKSTNGTENKTD